ncbi:Carbamoyl-phosphate synthase [Yamadazyma tenuis]|uniref:Pyrimidine-specific carbamoyl phosphate synthase-aspartate carbamoyl transferase n=1 Tax=Candida tenuis (strain ATCC 10573 / BCRC 21748 / CBS 615 / JCM 9827 / NBRC 10315 / NRRL Y-1498 / VKM Y-70) TaxID=590646 RepID=G3BFI5_CANTC|nr:carbamoyl-phosphate synth [Yamadazyma tenuis ATCC 10573]EGV60700.1 carbamoyl-phosphate synth [Yamadazyma tenuis ATCC 10573]WEJ94037.1 Carbamoyl-phosphate synthase [Yamadazyma tenuis]
MAKLSSPISPPMESTGDKMITLETHDGVALQGYSFGAPVSAAGEVVFQTGMVGYPESITDPSYEGQILVITYPLVGNYGVPDRELKDEDVPDLPKYFESSRIHIAGLVVAHYTEEYSHFLAKSSLGQWLKEQNIPAIYGVDTRALTKRLREGGSTLGRLCVQKADLKSQAIIGREDWTQYFDVPSWDDPNVKNLVAKVSTKEPKLYTPLKDVKLGKNGKPIRILAIDVGLKFNQIRCFVRRGVELKVVPWDHDITTEDYDGLFISNGPGDPQVMDKTVKQIQTVLESAKTPVFGICLGHQLMARASGASTLKLKFGNRGHNIPCTSTISGRCYITSQNHGFAVDTTTLSNGWKELFVNANDGSNEGIYHESMPFFSVQFHPESTPGPRDTEFLFDVFIQTVIEHNQSGVLKAVEFPGGKFAENLAAHPKQDVKKVLVLGSGGLSIGQAGEFDYSGSQAIKALKEEGIYTVLINPNIATIQTSKGLADKVYFLPVTPDFVRKVIEFEKPDGIYCTFGGQTALNVGIKLKDEFEGLGVRVLGTPIDTVITTEDRELFAQAMSEINEKCAKSEACSNVADCVNAANEIGYPLIIRAAYALGGLGSGFADNEEELVALCEKAFATSPQVLVERSMKGWKEVEYEVVRDAFDNCITVCNMENFDPLGIHTGDSIVVAPSQTLSDEDYNMLRTTAVNVIRHLGVVGECNIQYALNPFSKEYCIIEVNARLSRSSALASKATGYPLAYTAAKLGLNIPLNQIKNSVTKSTCACFEPSLDYVVVKIPRWDLKKFTRVSSLLSSSMKSVGEVMSIGRTFEEAIQKAIRSTDYHNLGFNQTAALMSIDIDAELQTPSDQRLFAIANAFSDGYSVDKVWKLTNIDKWFLNKLHGLISFGNHISSFVSKENLPVNVLREAKQLGFEDRQIAKFLNSNEVAIRRLRKEYNIIPFVKQIDTVAAEFPAFTNYLYITYNADTSDVKFDEHGVIVLGSGVYRIGSSVEFDWCAVRAIRTLRENDTKTIMINYNPETVSTDYDEADRLYFETINLERVLDIYELEQSSGVIISMGGQTSNNIALPLYRQNVKILGTSPEMIDSAENRYKFSRMLDKIGVDQPAWKELTSIDEAESFADAVSYPVLVRPSYVLSGAAMNTVYSKADLASYLSQAVDVSPDYPVVITKYIENAKEIEMDAVARNGKMIMHVVSEHVENAGVHSGDATLIVPPQDLDPETVRRIVEATAKIGKALDITGPYNIQFIAKDNDIKVIECNVRASRSFPFISKVVGTDLIEMATKAIMDFPLTPYPGEKLPEDYCAVKVPQFSFSRLAGADPVLGVEMASTGEVATFGRNKYEAYLKSLISTGFVLPKKNILFSIGSYKEKQELLPSIKKLHELGYKIFATAGTADFLRDHEIPVHYLEVLGKDEDQKSEYSLTQHLANNLIDLYVNLPSANRFRRPASYMSKGYESRRMAVDYSVPLVTNVKCAKLLVEAIARNIPLEVSNLDAQTSHTVAELPGLVNISSFVPSFDDFASITKASLASGFTFNAFLPQTLEGTSIVDVDSLEEAIDVASHDAYTDFAIYLAGSEQNSQEASDAARNAGALFLPFNAYANSKVSAISAHFALWPENKPIITDARTTDLASVLLLASLHSRSIHITGVSSKEDLDLITMAKDKQLSVTCDVSVFSLFLSQEDYPELSFLPTAADQRALWENLAGIDCFSIGVLPSMVAKALGLEATPGVGVQDALPLLLTAVKDGRLSVQSIIDHFHDAPVRIFNLPKQDAKIEVTLDRRTTVSSIFKNKKAFGSINRVSVHDETVCLDGKLVVSEATGKNEVDTSRARFGSVVTAPQSPILSRKNRKSFSFDNRRPSLGKDTPEPAEFEKLGKELVSQPPVGAGETNALINYIRNNNSFLRNSVLSVKDLTRSDMHALFSVAQEMRLAVERQGVLDLLKGRVLATMFYEPSTRTASSFDAAMQRLGGRVVAVAADASSVKKGETLQDTIRTLACYADAVVLRHPKEESADIAAKYSPVPIINGGNGSKEHPTQALLDLFTIREELGTVNGITVTFMGDLKYGRPVHSLCHLLRHYHVRVQLVAPKELEMPASLRQMLVDNNMLVIESEVLTPEIIAKSDVLYCTRVQAERFQDVNQYNRLKDVYIVDNKILSHAKQHMCVMHPLPRTNEIREEVDFDQRAAYFRQMRYGLFVRMALLAMVIGVDF